MPGCVALGCKSTRDKKLPGVTYHMFPQDDELRQKWVDAVARENWTATPYSILCSKHFRDDDLDRSSPFKTLVRRSAVPCIFPPAVEPSKAPPKKEQNGRKRKKGSDDSQQESLLIKKPRRKIPIVNQEENPTPRTKKQTPTKSAAPKESPSKVTEPEVILTEVRRNPKRKSKSIVLLKRQRRKPTVVKKVKANKPITKKRPPKKSSKSPKKKILRSELAPSTTETETKSSDLQGSTTKTNNVPKSPVQDPVELNIKQKLASIQHPVIDAIRSTTGSQDLSGIPVRRTTVTTPNGPMVVVVLEDTPFSVNKDKKIVEITPNASQQTSSSQPPQAQAQAQAQSAPPRAPLVQLPKKFPPILNRELTPLEKLAYNWPEPKPLPDLDPKPHEPRPPRLTEPKDLKEVVTRLRNQFKACKRKLHNERRARKRLISKTATLETQVKTLQETNFVYQKYVDMFKNISETGLAIIRRENHKVDNTKLKSEYDPKLRDFAETLYRISPRAYKFVRDTFQSSLPHQRTVLRWFQLNKEQAEGVVAAAAAAKGSQETQTDEVTDQTLQNELQTCSIEECIDETVAAYTEVTSVGDDTGEASYADSISSGLSEDMSSPADTVQACIIVEEHDYCHDLDNDDDEFGDDGEFGDDVDDYEGDEYDSVSSSYE